MSKRIQEGDGLSRREIIKTAGIVGAGITAVSMAVGGETLIAQPALAQDNLAVPVNGPQVMEVLYDPHSGVIIASAEKRGEKFRFGNPEGIVCEHAFVEIDMDKVNGEARDTKTEWLGENGLYLFNNGGLIRNPYARSKE